MLTYIIKRSTFIIIFLLSIAFVLFLPVMQGMFKRYTDRLLEYREAIFFAGLLLWIAIGFSGDQAPGNWSFYFKTILVAGVFMLPVILFAVFKQWLKTRLNGRRYLFLWLIFFGAIIPLLASIAMQTTPAGYPGWIFTTCAMCSIMLELLLVINDYYRQKLAGSKWMNRISLEKAILITIAVISVLLSAMAVSSMDNPAYDRNGQLLIGFVFVPSQLVNHFGAFISLFAQFLLMYLAGYLFFLINSRLLVGIILRKYGLMIYVFSMLTVTAALYPLVAGLLAALPVKDLLGGIFPVNAFAGENAAAVIAIMLLSLPILLSQQWIRQNSRIVSLEKEKAQAELDLLKQQINPHFLFNTLNNLYSLSLHHSEKTPDSILQLSDLMRYVIYKGSEDKVALQEEIRYMQDFMDLQQIRLRQPLALHFEKDINDPAIKIAPLLLIVFVENAFKHGIEPAEDPAFLHLNIKTNEQLLTFSCINSFEKGEEKQSGIGLTNLRKRLELLYPGRYLLHTEVKNHTFIAELQIELS